MGKGFSLVESATLASVVRGGFARTFRRQEAEANARANAAALRCNDPQIRAEVGRLTVELAALAVKSGESFDMVAVENDFYLDHAREDDYKLGASFVESATLASVVRGGTNGEVFWTDPDDGLCSGIATFIQLVNEEIAIIEKDGVQIEVYTDEIHMTI